MGKRLRLSLMVVWLSPHNRHGTIQLLNKDEAYHLMGKSHLGKGEFVVCLGIDIGRKSVRAANDEDEAFANGLHLLLHIF